MTEFLWSVTHCFKIKKKRAHDNILLNTGEPLESTFCFNKMLTIKIKVLCRKDILLDHNIRLPSSGHLTKPY